VRPNTCGLNCTIERDARKSGAPLTLTFEPEEGFDTSQILTAPSPIADIQMLPQVWPGLRYRTVR
jgi:hypothetical protein